MNCERCCYDDAYKHGDFKLCDSCYSSLLDSIIYSLHSLSLDFKIKDLEYLAEDILENHIKEL